MTTNYETPFQRPDHFLRLAAAGLWAAAAAAVSLPFLATGVLLWPLPLFLLLLLRRGACWRTPWRRAAASRLRDLASAAFTFADFADCVDFANFPDSAGFAFGR